ncbi:exported hypothetical protein [Verrucomicrobia bacterium]|nr:exported hypothetical protein [Verrucomicrobiota bacterium]
MSTKHKMRPAAIVAITVACALALTLGVCGIWAHYLAKRNEAIQLVTEGNPSDEQLLGFLQSSDRILLLNTLTLLEHRKTPAGRERAAKLLAHPDLYVWYCASLYLGAVGDQRSVP